MTKDLLLELGTEEIPARFIAYTKNAMKTFLEKKFKDLLIDYDEVSVKTTPRRFSIFIKNLTDSQKEKTETLKGPSEKIAFDENKKPSKALMGFLKSKGLTENDIKIVNGYVTAEKTYESKKTETYFKEVFEEMIDKLSFAKPMRWGGNRIKFIRPVRWILCLYGDEVPELEMFGLKASNMTKGHRFLGAGNLEVKSIDKYEKLLEENYVILDDIKRKAMIEKGIHDLADSLGAKIIEDDDLMDEINYIVEYPTPLYGESKEEYLKLPQEAVITPMKEHQRYFPLLKGGKLINKFITVRNGDSYKMENVKEGNEKVLDARLSDAKFFYEQDTKNPLASYVENLKTIVYHQKLGSMYNKAMRLSSLSEQYAKLIGADKEKAKRAAMLCKADLTTSMVFEFTELQGVMGRYYAISSGEDKTVADAIYEHYLPRFAGDETAKTDVGVCVSLADKFDSIAGFFAVDIKPTGSQDPYALRRMAIGALNTLIQSKVSVPLEVFVERALANYEGKIDFDMEKVIKDILEFMKQRLKNSLLEQNLSHDAVNSVLGADESVIYDIYQKAKAVENFANEQNKGVLDSFNRVINISKDNKKDEIDKGLLTADEEKNLLAALDSLQKKLSEFISSKDFEKAITALSELKEPIDAYFDNVMIMDKDEKIKQNRLNTVTAVRNTINSIADFSKLSL